MYMQLKVYMYLHNHFQIGLDGLNIARPAFCKFSSTLPAHMQLKKGVFVNTFSGVAQASQI